MSSKNLSNKLKITYECSTFNAEQAAAADLCLMVDKGYSGSTIGSTDDAFHGAGFCKQNGSTFILTVDGEDYRFNPDGTSLGTNTLNYCLMMGTVHSNYSPVRVGSAVATDSTTHISVPSSGTPSVNDEGAPLEVTMVDNLTARDEFAIQALRGMMNNSSDLAQLSDTQISHYCDAAYQWASNMMAAAAKTRAAVEVTGSTTASAVAVGTPQTTEERIQNNTLVELGNITTKLAELANIKTNLAELTNITTKINALSQQITDLKTAVGQVKASLDTIAGKLPDRIVIL